MIFRLFSFISCRRSACIFFFPFFFAFFLARCENGKMYFNASFCILYRISLHFVFFIRYIVIFECCFAWMVCHNGFARASCLNELNKLNDWKKILSLFSFHSFMVGLMLFLVFIFSQLFSMVSWTIFGFYSFWKCMPFSNLLEAKLYCWKVQKNSDV